MSAPVEHTRLRVVCAFVARGSSVLVAQRPVGHPHAGMWEFPGGKIETGERPEEALVRELLEELNVDAQVGAWLATGVDENIQLDCYNVALVGEPVALEHAMLAWVESTELDRLPMPPADSQIVTALISLKPRN